MAVFSIEITGNERMLDSNSQDRLVSSLEANDYEPNNLFPVKIREETVVIISDE
jgi:hypothetical protein